MTGCAPASLIVRADGGSRGNPGRAGCGAVLIHGTTGELLAWDYRVVGFATNNVAEYMGLILGLHMASKRGSTSADVEMDSRLVIEQMRGRWAVKDPTLQRLAAEAAEVASRFQNVTYAWIRRGMNALADELANQAMDGRKLSKPSLAGGPITTRRITPTVKPQSSRLPPSMRVYGQGEQAARVEQTAALAVANGIDGTPTEIAAALIRLSRDELAGIWGRVPSDRWLSEKIAASPVSWRKGLATALGQAS